MTRVSGASTNNGGILHIRRHLAVSSLFKGIPFFRETRIRMLRADTKQELFDIIASVEEKLANGEAFAEPREEGVSGEA